MTIKKEEKEVNKAQTAEFIVEKDKKVNLLMEATGDEGLYSTSVFVDNRHIDKYAEEPIIWKIRLVLVNLTKDFCSFARRNKLIIAGL